MRRLDGRGKACEEVRTFATLTRQLLALADGLAEAGGTPGAREATGVSWQPVDPSREGRFEWLLVNAQHLKQVPGRKTDVKDCVWLAQLLQQGLLKARWVPPPPQRELRDRTRQRSQRVAA
jgi:transposase